MKIEKNNDNLAKIEEHYKKSKVLFEECILESSKYHYRICYFPLVDTYSVLILNNINSEVLNFESRKKLSNSTLKYFNIYKDDYIEDGFGNRLKCISHHIEIEKE